VEASEKNLLSRETIRWRWAETFYPAMHGCDLHSPGKTETGSRRLSWSLRTPRVLAGLLNWGEIALFAFAPLVRSCHAKEGDRARLKNQTDIIE